MLLKFNCIKTSCIKNEFDISSLRVSKKAHVYGHKTQSFMKNGGQQKCLNKILTMLWKSFQICLFTFLEIALSLGIFTHAPLHSELTFFLSGFSFTNINDSQDSRGRGRVSI